MSSERQLGDDERNALEMLQQLWPSGSSSSSSSSRSSTDSDRDSTAPLQPPKNLAAMKKRLLSELESKKKQQLNVPPRKKQKTEARLDSNSLKSAQTTTPVPQHDPIAMPLSCSENFSEVATPPSVSEKNGLLLGENTIPNTVNRSTNRFKDIDTRLQQSGSVQVEMFNMVSVRQHVQATDSLEGSRLPSASPVSASLPTRTPPSMSSQGTILTRWRQLQTAFFQQRRAILLRRQAIVLQIQPLQRQRILRWQRILQHQRTEQYRTTTLPLTSVPAMTTTGRGFFGPAPTVQLSPVTILHRVLSQTASPSTQPQPQPPIQHTIVSTDSAPSSPPAGHSI